MGLIIISLKTVSLNRFKIIAFTHKSTELSNLGKFFMEEQAAGERLSSMRKEIDGLGELFYLSTCNRVEFALTSSRPADKNFLSDLFRAFNPAWGETEIQWAIQHCLLFEGEDALRHLMHVASSIDSLVVGEREILAQVRKAYDVCREKGFTGDFLRLAMESTVKTAKEIFTKTQIADRPVSVVSLAYRKLRDLHVPLDARFVIIGAGQTNTTMAQYLLKHGFKNFTVFNRSLKNAESLAKTLGGKAFPLTELANYQEGFDVIISCTSSSVPILTKETYSTILGKDKAKKILIDLAVPNDIDKSISENFETHGIGVETLKSIAEENLRERKKELVTAERIAEENILAFAVELKERKIELAMQDVPKKIREIRQTAVNSVFAKDIEQLDGPSKEVLEKVLAYMEKKYISVPMIMAKEILISQQDA